MYPCPESHPDSALSSLRSPGVLEHVEVQQVLSVNVAAELLWGFQMTVCQASEGGTGCAGCESRVHMDVVLVLLWRVNWPKFLVPTGSSWQQVALCSSSTRPQPHPSASVVVPHIPPQLHSSCDG